MNKLLYDDEPNTITSCLQHYQEAGIVDTKKEGYYGSQKTNSVC